MPSDSQSAPVVGSTMYLVSCVAKKRTTPSRAKDLYMSAWFTKARAFVEATGRPWFILSAEHGLVPPDVTIAPYERTLNRMGKSDRRAWAIRVAERLIPELGGVQRLVVLAGERYREFLLPLLVGSGPEIEVPLTGLRIGEQLHWFTERERERA